MPLITGDVQFQFSRIVRRYVTDDAIRNRSGLFMNYQQTPSVRRTFNHWVSAASLNIPARLTY